MIIWNMIDDYVFPSCSQKNHVPILFLIICHCDENDPIMRHGKMVMFPSSSMVKIHVLTIFTMFQQLSHQKNRRATIKDIKGDFTRRITGVHPPFFVTVKIWIMMDYMYIQCKFIYMYMYIILYI